MTQRKNYSTCSKIIEACRLYHEGTVTNLSLLAKQFGVDRKSLRERVKAKVKVDAHQGRETFLSSAVENEISECLQVLCGWGWGFTRTELLDLVQDYILDSGLQSPFTNGRPGRKWFNRFMRDHPELSIRKSEQFPVARAQASADTGKITHWFEVLKKEMDLAGVTTKPQNIYNVDETGFVTDASSAYVLARKGCPNVYQSTGGSGREQITVCITGNAAGQFLPPFIVYKGKHLYSSWCQGGPDHARFAVTEHGWMEKIVFLDYFTNLFLHESARLSDLKSPRILIFDGHTSHVSLSLAVKAKENNVVLLRLPSHLTHNLQPLDKAVFGEVKKQWQKKLRCHARVSRDKIRKEDFPQKLKDVLDVALKPKNIISGFESTGIYPFNPQCALVGMESDTPFATHIENPLTTPPNMPLTTPPNMPLTTPPNMPLTTPPNMPLTTPPNMPLTTSPNMPLTTSPNMPLTTPKVHPAVPLSVPTVTSVSQSTAATSPCLTAGDDESASQIILSVETIPGSNMLNITNIEISRPQSASSSFQNTSSKTSPTSNTGVKEFFLQRLQPKKNVPSMKRKRISILKYGESLTSEQALERLNEAEKKKLNKQKTEKKKTKGTQGANSDKADNDIHEKENNVITDAFPIQRDAYYAVMFTMPAAYYVARALNESSPLHGETSFVMKFLDRGPNNTYNLPLREKIEDVERRFILCSANLEGAGPFYLTNHNEVENLYKQKLKSMK